MAGEITIIGETGSVCSRTLTLLGQTRASGSKTVTILGETRTLQCKLIFSVTVSSADASQGTASGGGEVEYGQSITIRAAAKAGYAFSHWTKNGAAVQGAGAVTPMRLRETMRGWRILRMPRWYSMWLHILWW